MSTPHVSICLKLSAHRHTPHLNSAPPLPGPLPFPGPSALPLPSALVPILCSYVPLMAEQIQENLHRLANNDGRAFDLRQEVRVLTVDLANNLLGESRLFGGLFFSLRRRGDD